MDSSQATSLLLISIGAFAVPLFSVRIGIPAAAGEMVFGILTGPHLLGVVGKSGFFDFLADFGFAYLMFLAGMELNFGKMERRGTRGFLMSVMVAVLILGLAFLVARVMGWSPFLAMILGAMSVGILLVVLKLKEAGIAQSSEGQTIIWIGSTGEFLTILIATLFNISYRFGLGLAFLEELSKLFLVFMLAYFVLRSLRLLVWWYPSHFSRMVEIEDPSEVGVRAGLALMIAFVAISSLLGVEEILGAFLAGALFSFVFREKGILEAKMAGIGQGFFIPIFFIHVGVSFNLAAAAGPGIAPLVGQLLLFSILVKFVPALLLMVERFSVRDVAGTALLLSAPLTIIVAIAAIGRELGAIDELTNASVILLAVFSGVLFPTLFKWIHKRNAT